jgi:hypothetical protein
MVFVSFGLLAASVMAFPFDSTAVSPLIATCTGWAAPAGFTTLT